MMKGTTDEERANDIISNFRGKTINELLEFTNSTIRGPRSCINLKIKILNFESELKQSLRYLTTL